MTGSLTTDELISALSKSPPPPRFRADVAALAIAMAVLACVGMFWLVFGMRADLAGQLAVPMTVLKSLLPLSIGAMALWLAMSSARPEGRVLLWVLALPAGLALLLFGMRALSVPEGQLVRELVGQAAVPCLVSIPMLSVVPLAVGLWLLRRGAPTRPVVSGALVGLAVSAGSAAGYALHCSEDSPLFFVVWYGLAIAISTTAGALAGHRLLRW